MLGGSYPAQSIRPDSKKDTATANVIFRAAPGATVVLPNSTLTISGAHVEFHQLKMDQTDCANVKIKPPCPSLLIQFPAHDVVIDHLQASRFFITGAYNVSISDSDFGPAWDDHGIIHADSKGNRPHHIRLLRVTVHDHWNTDACKAQPGCISANHQGCGPTLNDSYDVVEDSMRFFNCEDLGQLVKPYKFGNENITIQNSWFGLSKGFYSLNVGSNSKLPNKGLHIRNNTFSSGIVVSRGIPYPDSELTGNLIPSLSCSTYTSDGWTVAYNIVKGKTPCGHSGRAVANFGLAPDGLHLLRGSPAIDFVHKTPSTPATDIDGQARPRRSPADAGADQWEPATIILGRSIGSAQIGMTERAVEDFYGPPSTRKARVKYAKDARLRYASYRVHGGWLTIGYSNDQVVGLATSSPYYTTASGIGVQSPRAALGRATWMSCRKAYRQTVKGVNVFYAVVSRKRGNVRSVALLGSGIKPC
jgi:hypothetical protein